MQTAPAYPDPEAAKETIKPIYQRLGGKPQKILRTRMWDINQSFDDFKTNDDLVTFWETYSQKMIEIRNAIQGSRILRDDEKKRFEDYYIGINFPDLFTSILQAYQNSREGHPLNAETLNYIKQELEIFLEELNREIGPPQKTRH